MKRIIFFTLLSLFAIFKAYSSEKYKSYNLQSPLDIPLLLSGNFAELRSSHFHAGIDFKTQGQIGLPVRAVADGYLSRINISTGGYGKALYIDHPELDLTTVYAHLDHFTPKLDSITKSYHYAQKSYNINVFPEKKYWVKKGDIIAYSGNTGSSAGPHLHFETRERSTQDPINPLFFGFNIIDTTNPIINGLRIYPYNNEGVVNNKSDQSTFFPVVYYSGKYHLKGNPTINAWGKVGFAINTLDYLDGSWNKCGIYSIELLVDCQRIYKQEMDRISYSEMRYIEAHVDPEIRIKSRVDYQYSFLAKPNNKLSIYKEMVNNGIVNITDSTPRLITYRIKDTYGNTSILEFTVHGKAQKITQVNNDKNLKWDAPHQFSSNQFKLEIPAKAFYENQTINYSVSDSSTYLSPIIRINNNNKPLNKTAKISIRPDSNTGVPLEKMVICKIGTNGKAYPLSSIITDNTLNTRVYSFGDFAISYDTIAPTITPINIFNGKQFNTNATFGFKVKDNFTGISDYKATIDGEWALFYFERKQNYIYYTIDPTRLTKGKEHQLVFKIWDATGNITSYNSTFFW